MSFTYCSLLMLPSPRGIQLGAEPVGERALRVLEMPSPDDMHRHSEVALGDRAHESVAKALLAPQVFFVAGLECEAFQLDDLNQLVVFREQRFGVVVGDIRNESPQPLLLLLRLAAGGSGLGKIEPELSQDHSSYRPTLFYSRPCPSARSRSTRCRSSRGRPDTSNNKLHVTGRRPPIPTASGSRETL